MDTNERQRLIHSIEEFYLPRHLVNAIFDIGHIPVESKEGQVGVGFIDIADYTHLSRFLSPKENQILLNGLYTAFHIVLERHGGYLNKIEGDSMMFQFDDVINKSLRDMDLAAKTVAIARELFYTCVDMQRVCILFNHANDDFLEIAELPESRVALAEAFTIIKALREKDDIASTLFAFFQIRIRIGANLGEVTIGNFGPSGSKHWDIIGLPVINAKRMESTAPVGGLRVSEDFFDVLKANGIAEDYFREFRAEAAKTGCVYRDIDWDELFRFREVVIQEKRGATYRTYSVQVYPALPESITRQATELLNHGEAGARQILEFFRYYRANHFIVDSLEEMLGGRGVAFRKTEILTLIAPRQTRAKKAIDRLSLFKILNYMDQYLDFVQAIPDDNARPDFISYDQYMTAIREQTASLYARQQKMIIQRTYFTEVVVRQVYASLESSIREWQIKRDEPEEAEDADTIDEPLDELGDGRNGVEELDDLDELEELDELGDADGITSPNADETKSP